MTIAKCSEYFQIFTPKKFVFESLLFVCLRNKLVNADINHFVTKQNNHMYLDRAKQHAFYVIGAP